jgi:phosphoribosylamine--glycine ligase
MKILVLGSGGREHAFCHKIKESKTNSQLFIAPGNAGTALLGENVSIQPNDFELLKKFCLAKQIEMVIVGPEEPLVMGIYDFFKDDRELQHIIITGPSMNGAQLEGSKAFSKNFMEKYKIPTARYKEFNAQGFEEGVEYIKNHALPVVLKADGLAAGKGVIICMNHKEAIEEFTQMIQHSKFGTASNKVVIEEFLDGLELSVFILTDGKNYVLLPEAKDYKKIGEGDSGLNTGGMGAISPVPFATDHFMEKVKEQIIEPTIHGLKKEGIDYRGFLFFGLIKVLEEPYVIEYNCRLGDPEAEVILLRMKNDLIDLFKAMNGQNLHKEKIEIYENSAATIVAVSGGYPLDYEKGVEVELGYLENPQAIKHIEEDRGVQVFHCGTLEKKGQIVTNGGRVLAVSAMAGTLAESIELSKEIIRQIHFEGMYYRTDIGYEFIE